MLRPSNPETIDENFARFEIDIIADRWMFRNIHHMTQSRISIRNAKQLDKFSAR